MKKIRNIVAASALTLAMGVTSITVFAAAKYDTPQEALAGMTGKTVEEITERKAQENLTYGAIAAEEGKLDEFKVELLEQKREMMEERVTEGDLEKEDADAILERIQERQETCIGEGNPGEGMMEGSGVKFGNGPEDGQGNGNGLQSGEGNGLQSGEGNGLQSGEGNGNGNGSGRNK
jgi:hypothetical protein